MVNGLVRLHVRVRDNSDPDCLADFAISQGDVYVRRTIILGRNRTAIGGRQQHRHWTGAAVVRWIVT